MESGRALVPKAGAVQGRLGVSDAPVGEEGDAVTEGLRVDQAQRLPVAGLAEEARAGPEHDREDLQPQLVDEVVLDQRASELEAGGDVDFPVSSCFSFETSFTTSPLRTVELFQSGSSRVEDTTYLGRPFNLSASSPVRDGHRAANHS